MDTKTTKQPTANETPAIVITPENIDNVQFDGIIPTVQMSTRQTDEHDPVIQTLNVNLTGETLFRIINWAMFDRRIAFQRIVRDNAKTDETWQTANPVINIVSCDQWQTRTPKQPVDPMETLRRAVASGTLTREQIIAELDARK